VAAGRGVSLVPAPVARLSPHADVVYVAVSDADPAVVSLAWRSRPLPPIVRAFIATARRLAGDRGGDPRRLDGDD
jgi:DNA-binding transcriptional LysR family regulator